MPHPSQIFFVSALAFISGVFINSIFPGAPQTIIIGAAVAALSGILSAAALKKLKSFYSLIAIAAILFLISGIFYSAWRQPNPILNARNQSIHKLTVNSYVEKTYYGYKFAANADGVNIKILLDEKNTSVFHDLAYGDQIMLRGEYEWNAKRKTYELNFPSVLSVKPLKTFSIMRGVFASRRFFENSLEKIYQFETAQFAKGILLGSDGQFSKELKEDFQRAGAQHLTAVSGYNLTVITFGLMEFLLLLGIKRKFAFIPSIMLILIFVIMTGASSATSRAGFMSLLLISSQNFGRLSSTKNALAFAALALIIWQPSSLVFDLGFQLSFLAAFGLLYVAPIIKLKLEEKLRLKSKFINKIVSETTGAQFMVIPLLLYSFGRFNIVAFPANYVALPFIPYAMLAAFIGGVTGILNDFLGQIVSFITAPFINLPIYAIKFFGNMPGFNLGIVSVSLPMLIIIYALMSYVLYKKMKQNYE